MTDSESEKHLQEDLPSEKTDPAERDKTEFRNALEISSYLEAEGWKVSKSTVYKHIKEAKLRPDIDKVRYSLKAVLRYARAFLVTRETKQKLADEELARQKAKKELEKLDEEIKRQRIKRLAEEGSLIPRADFELELAARAAVLEAGITQMIQTEAGRYIELVKGDSALVGDLIRELREGFNLVLNEFASVRDLEVVFAAQKEE